MDIKALRDLHDEMMGWYWPKNGPHPLMAYAVMVTFISEAKARACVENDERVRRGELIFVAKDFCNRHNVTERTFRTICDKLCDHKLTLKRHSKNKKSTIITVCKYNVYEPLKRKGDMNSDIKTTTKRQQTGMTPTNLIGTRDNINNNNGNIIKINKNYNSGGGTPARAGGQVVSGPGEPPIVAEVNALLQDDAYIATLSGRFNRGVDWVRLKLQSFRESHKGDGPHGNRSDLERHIGSWLQIQVKYEDGKRRTREDAAVHVPEPDGVVVHDGDIPSRAEVEDYHRRAMAAVGMLGQ